MNEYLLPFNEIFKSIIEIYGFQVKGVRDDKVLLLKDTYQIEFTMWRETVEVSFCIVKSKSEMLKYNVRDFIITSMTAADRVTTGLDVTADKTVVYARNINSLHYFSNALRNHFPSMLAGEMNWLESYEKSEWCHEPVIEKRDE